MSKEAGELQHSASPPPHGPENGYSRAPPTASNTHAAPELAAEDSVPGALADSSLIAARHRHHEAKENVASALNPALSNEKVSTQLITCVEELGLLQMCVATKEVL